MNVVLKRVLNSGEGIQGVLIYNDSVIMNTIERPWMEDTNPGGMPYLSCVPEGQYECEKVYSERFGEVFVLVNHELGVYKDKGFRFRCYLGHVANYPKDVQGCIGLGLKWWPDKVAIQESNKAVKLFKRIFDDVDQLTLNIRR